MKNRKVSSKESSFVLPESFCFPTTKESNTKGLSRETSERTEEERRERERERERETRERERDERERRRRTNHAQYTERTLFIHNYNPNRLG